MSLANFLQVGKWFRCAHCRNVYAGEHYCGAEWQYVTPGSKLNDIPSTWVNEIRCREEGASERVHDRSNIPVEELLSLIILKELQPIMSAIDRIATDLSQISTDLSQINDGIKALRDQAGTIPPDQLAAAVEAQLGPIADNVDATTAQIDSLAASFAAATTPATPPAS